MTTARDRASATYSKAAQTKIEMKKDGVRVGECKIKKATCFIVSVAPHDRKNGPAPAEAWSVDSSTIERYASERSHAGLVGQIETHNLPLATVQTLVKAFRPAVDECLTMGKQ